MSPDMLKPMCQALEHTKTLTALDVSGNGLGADPSLKHLQKLLEYCTTLKSLSLRHNGFVDNEEEVYEFLFRKDNQPLPTSLTDLDFSHNKFSDSTFMEIVRKGLDGLHDTPLKILNLTGNPIRSKDNKDHITLTLKTVKEKFQGLTINMD